ncbi:MAG TPA: hypothetical protein PLP17_06655, partial [Oligoflexia bacterium]|nr:hypothetical protein [Oligoflexia bacterium]
MHNSDRPILLGVFFVALATVMFEILLTRIFSVTMWYHFAFFCVSVAMFGMTAGAVIVQVRPLWFDAPRVYRRMAQSSFFFAVSLPLALLMHLSIPIVFEPSSVTVFALLITYLVVAVPFVCSGVCICLALTKCGAEVSRVYAADLAGAAASCIFAVVLLKIFDGPSAVVLAGVFPAAASFLFAGVNGDAGQSRRGAVLAAVLLLCGMVNGVLARAQMPFLRLQWVKGRMEKPLVYEQWNSFSRIAVWKTGGEPASAGFSSELAPGQSVGQMQLEIDAQASTVLTAFDGDLAPLEFLRSDVTNVVHALKRNARVFVIGSGGGRDILSALVSGQREITGVEVNEDIIATLNERFGEFTGHLDKLPNVKFVADEARSFLRRARAKYDVIQISLIDTWAATAAGALSLTENSLYTVEAWREMLEHLAPGGVLSVSRWYSHDNPLEIYRTLSLARSALESLGAEDPAKQIAVVTNINEHYPPHYNGIATVLVSRDPFPPEALQALRAAADKWKFTVLVSPETAANAVFRALASADDLRPLKEQAPYNLEPPTDDQPFFFNMLRFSDLFKKRSVAARHLDNNAKAAGVLYLLLLVTVVLSYYVVVAPLRAAGSPGRAPGFRPLSAYFICIGLGYMLIEIALIQRLTVFLGHPVYGLAVVLFTLLLASSIGSFGAKALCGKNGMHRVYAVFVLLLVLLAISSAFMLPVIEHFRRADTWQRLLAAASLSLPLGLCMGAPFPFGMALAQRRSAAFTPW